VNTLATSLWNRACEALAVARHDLPVSADAAASRAYYAAFYAVSAHFALSSQDFTKHTAVEAAVHRELVKNRTWPDDLGHGYSRLAQLRTLSDYGTVNHVSQDEAQEAVHIAARILLAVAQLHPAEFSAPAGEPG
jgi:uncharacterized protein (UPF0332 family)